MRRKPKGKYQIAIDLQDSINDEIKLNKDQIPEKLHKLRVKSKKQQLSPYQSRNQLDQNNQENQLQSYPRQIPLNLQQIKQQFATYFGKTQINIQTHQLYYSKSKNITQDLLNLSKNDTQKFKQTKQQRTELKKIFKLFEDNPYFQKIVKQQIQFIRAQINSSKNIQLYFQLAQLLLEQAKCSLECGQYQTAFQSYQQAGETIKSIFKPQTVQQKRSLISKLKQFFGFQSIQISPSNQKSEICKNELKMNFLQFYIKLLVEKIQLNEYLNGDFILENGMISQLNACLQDYYNTFKLQDQNTFKYQQYSLQMMITKSRIINFVDKIDTKFKQHINKCFQKLQQKVEDVNLHDKEIKAKIISNLLSIKKKKNQKNYLCQNQINQKLYKDLIDSLQKDQNADLLKVLQLRSELGFFLLDNFHLEDSKQQATAILEIPISLMHTYGAKAYLLLCKIQMALGNCKKSFQNVSKAYEILTTALLKEDNSEQYRKIFLNSETYRQIQLQRIQIYNDQNDHDLALKTLEYIAPQSQQRFKQSLKSTSNYKLNIRFQAALHEERGHTKAFKKDYSINDYLQQFQTAIDIRSKRDKLCVDNGISYCNMAKYLLSEKNLTKECFKKAYYYLRQAEIIFNKIPSDHSRQWIFYFMLAELFNKSLKYQKISLKKIKKSQKIQDNQKSPDLAFFFVKKARQLATSILTQKHITVLNVRFEQALLCPNDQQKLKILKALEKDLETNDISKKKDQKGLKMFDQRLSLLNLTKTLRNQTNSRLAKSQLISRQKLQSEQKLLAGEQQIQKKDNQILKCSSKSVKSLILDSDLNQQQSYPFNKQKNKNNVQLNDSRKFFLQYSTNNKQQIDQEMRDKYQIKQQTI